MTWTGDVTLTVEFGFGSGPLAASPTFTDLVADVRGLTVNRGRSSVRSTFDAGSCTITLDNTGGDYDPNNSQSSHFGDMKLGTPVRVQATYNTVTYPVFRGHVTRWPLSYPMSGKDAVVTIEATENLAILNTALLSDQAYTVEGTDDRIDAILDDAGWPAGARDLDAGVASVAGLTFSGSPLALILDTVEAEQGEFFIAKDGDATFLNRVAFSGAASQATFDPGTNLDYTAVQLIYDDDLLINSSAVTASDDSVGEASDSTSITDHGERGFSSSNESIVGEPDAQNVAEWIVGKRKDVAVRVTGFTIKPQEDPTNLWPEVLDRELRDVVTVKVTPPAGDQLNQAVAVEGISHDITPGTWLTTYTCHPLSTFESQDYWILGTSELGTDTRLA